MVADTLHLCYTYLRLPAAPRASLLFIGPYLRAPLSSAQVLELAEKNGIPPNQHGYLKEYFGSVPVLPPGSPLLTMLHTFCERTWKSPTFAIADVNHESQMPVSPIHELTVNRTFDDVMMGMKAMETRYGFE